MQFVLRLGRAAPFLLAAFICVLLFGIANQFDFVARPGQPDPSVWPKIILILIMLASAWGALEQLLVPGDDDGLGPLVRAAVRAVGRESEAQADLEAEAGLGGQCEPLRVLAAIAAMFGFVGGIAYVGFTVAAFSLMFAVMVLAGYQRYFFAILISLLGALAFFLVFQRVAYVSLPLGVGPFKALSTTLMATFGVR
jgi:hypothetical protein